MENARFALHNFGDGRGAGTQREPCFASVDVDIPHHALDLGSVLSLDSLRGCIILECGAALVAMCYLYFMDLLNVS